MKNDVSTSALKGHRTLATVVFTDCVSFSARMSVDENQTLRLIHRDLKLMKRLCEQFEGRVLKSTGDGLLMHFISAVKAVECAIAIQTSLAAAAEGLTSNDVLKHRIGIHLADIFITETDVMGNGVNIAARLQAAADPGGICVSQTVYDVVKAGLDIRTRYLGPQELKNIREIVPVYKILLTAEDEILDEYTDVVRRLEQSQNLHRIKKLLFYICNKVWENDPQRIDLLDLRQLIHGLVEQAPTLDRLRTLLTASVKTLSKRAEYSLVANVITHEVWKLYRSGEVLSGPLSEEAPVDDDPLATAPYEPIAQTLEQAEPSARLKKLMFYVCNNRWESDALQLAHVPLSELVAQLHRLAPTLEDLSLLLDRFVQTLSKQTEYRRVASTITTYLQPLYGNSDAAVASVEADRSAVPEASNVEMLSLEHQQRYGNMARSLEASPGIRRIKKLLVFVCQQRWESDPTTLASLHLETLIYEVHQLAATTEQLEAALSRVVKTLNKQDEYVPIAQTIVQTLRPLYEEPSTPSPSQHANLEPVTSEPSVSEPAPGSLNLFDVRLGIMKYANPIRAKILVFSALHEPFGFTRQDWLNLKMHEFDGLLRQLLQVCKTYTDLEALVYRTARQLKDAEETMETAEVVIRCLRSLYVHGSPAAILALSDPTSLNLDEFEQATQELADESEIERTCQLLLTASEVPTTFELSCLSSLQGSPDADSSATAEDQTRLELAEIEAMLELEATGSPEDVTQFERSITDGDVNHAHS